MIKRLFILLFLFAVSNLAFALKIGDIVTTKEGDEGVVFYLNQEKILIVSTSSDCENCSWSSSNSDIEGIENCKNRKDLLGKENTQVLLDVQNENLRFQALGAINTANGWYLPSLSEMYLLANVKDVVNESIKKAHGNTLFDGIFGTSYWTSSEYDENLAWIFTYNSVGYGEVTELKNTKNAVRGIKEYCIDDITRDSTLFYKWNTGHTTQFIQDTPINTYKYNVEVKNEYGCVTSIDKTVAVLNSGEQEIFDTICAGETYQKFGIVATESGSYKTTIGNKDCSSNMTIHLFVNQIYKYEIKDNICQGELFEKNGYSKTPMVPGQLEDTLFFKTTTGCDSLIIFNLNVRPITYDTVFNRICQTDIYADDYFNLPAYLKSGKSFYTVERLGDNGCKQYHTLALQVDTSYQISLVDSICKGNKYEKFGFTIEGQDSTKVYQLKLNSERGCDSIVNLRLVVVPEFADIDTVVICEGDSVLWRNRIIKEQGVYYDSLKNSFGCDSVYELDLTIAEQYSDSIYENVKAGLIFEKYGYSFKPYADTVLIDSMLTVNGCDSVRTIFIEFIPSDTSYISGTICGGEPYEYNEVPYDQPGEYTILLKDQTGADSIIVLKIDASELIRDTVNVSICGANPEYTWNGVTYKHSTIVSDTIQRETGCDSISVLDLRISKSYQDTIIENTCKGDDLKWEESGLYVDSLLAITGCDSIIVTDYRIHPVYYDTISVDLKEGDIFTDGLNEYMIAGEFRQKYSTTYGCDSIKTVRVSFHTVYEDTICSGETYKRHGFFVDTEGQIKNIVSKEAGIDSVSILNLVVKPAYYFVETDSVCMGETYYWDTEEIEADYRDSSYIGTYRHESKTIFGCDSISKLQLFVKNSRKVEIDKTICSGEQYLFHGNNLDTFGTYTFYSETDRYCETEILKLNVAEHPVLNDVVYDGVNYKIIYLHQEDYSPYLYCIDGKCQDNPIWGRMMVGKHEVVLSDKNGCQTEMDFLVSGEIRPWQFFTPNGDGFNEMWQIDNIETFPNNVVSIYDRWGKLLITYKGYDNRNVAWDGIYNGHAMPSTDYWYAIEIEELGKTYTGHFTLIRQ